MARLIMGALLAQAAGLVTPEKRGDFHHWALVCRLRTIAGGKRGALR
jgi:hypothetical protein